MGEMVKLIRGQEDGTPEDSELVEGLNLAEKWKVKKQSNVLEGWKGRLKLPKGWMVRTQPDLNQAWKFNTDLPQDWKLKKKSQQSLGETI